MQRCRNCGCEFDGKFCPDCGAKWVDKRICPECGTESSGGARFCNECGHAFESAASGSRDGGSAYYAEPTVAATVVGSEKPSRVNVREDSKGASDLLRKIYTALRYVPMAMLAAFSVLLWLFYLAPIASLDMGFLGMSEDFGSVYSFYDEFTAACAVLLVFALIVLVYAAVTLAVFFRAKTKNREVRLFGKLDMTLGETVAAASVVMYFVFMIVVAVIMGKISAADEGMDVLSAGAALKLALAFSIIFMILGAAAVAVRILFGKKFPELWLAESQKRQEQEAERERREAESAAARAAQSSAFDARSEQGAYADNKTAYEIRTGVRPLLYYAYSNLKLQRAVRLAFTAVCLSILAAFVLIVLTLTEVLFTVSPHLPIIIGFAVAVFAVVMCLIVPVKNWSPDRFRDLVSKKRRHDKGKSMCKKAVFLYFILAYVIAMIVVFALVFNVVMRAYVIVGVYGFVTSIALFIAENAVAKRNNALAEYLFGQPGPPPVAPLIVPYDEQTELAAYKEYKLAVKQKRARRESDDVRKKLSKRRVKLGVSGVMFTAVALFAMIAMPVMTDLFSAGYVAYYPRGEADRYLLQYYFGMPHTATRINGTATVTYYDDAFLDLYEEMHDITGRIEDAVNKGDFEGIASLEKQLGSLEERALKTTFKYLTLTFVNDNYSSSSDDTIDYYDYLTDDELPYSFLSDKELRSIVLDAHCLQSDIDATKSVKSVKLDKANVLRYSDPSAQNLYAEIYYTDGSYKYAPLSGRAFADLDTSKLGSQKITWEDDWGSYSTYVNVVGSITDKLVWNGGENSVEYTLTVKDDGSERSVRLALSDYRSRYSYSDSLPNVTAWNACTSVITEVHFDESIPYGMINEFGFGKYTALKNISVSTANQSHSSANGVLYNKDKTELVCVPQGMTGDLVVPGTVTTIRGSSSSYENNARGAFFGSHLDSVYIPKSVTRIYSYAFYACPSLVIYAEAEEPLFNWSSNWNGGCPVVWNAERP